MSRTYRLITGASLGLRLSLIFLACWQNIIFYLMDEDMPSAMRHFSHFSGFVQLFFPEDDLPISAAFADLSQWRHEEMPAAFQWIPNRECKAQSVLLQEVGLIQAAAPGTMFASIKKTVPLHNIATLKNNVGQKAAAKYTLLCYSPHPREEHKAPTKFWGTCPVPLWVDTCPFR